MSKVKNAKTELVLCESPKSTSLVEPSKMLIQCIAEPDQVLNVPPA